MTGWRKRTIMKMAQEPVAWVEYETGNHTKRPQNCGTGYCSCIECVIEPPQRTWVGLTEEDLKLLSAEWRIVYGAWMDDFAKDIEAKLKEKNT